MDKDNNVYKRVGRKYVPIGLRIDDHWLGDGIWIVRHCKYGRSITRADYLANSYGLIKAGEITNIDLVRLSAMEPYVEVAAKVIADNQFKSITPMDLARLVVKELFDFGDKITR